MIKFNLISKFLNWNWSITVLQCKYSMYELILDLSRNTPCIDIEKHFCRKSHLKKNTGLEPILACYAICILHNFIFVNESIHLINLIFELKYSFKYNLNNILKYHLLYYLFKLWKKNINPAFWIRRTNFEHIK